MTEATMRGLLRSAAHRVPLLALLAFSTAYAPGASAQTTGGTATQSANQAIDSNLVVKRNGKIIKNGTLVFADIADCGGDPKTTDGSEFEFSVTYTANAAVVELWLGVGTGENCATLANRIKQSNNTAPPVCTFLGTVTTGTRNPVIRVKGSQLFRQSGWNNTDDRITPGGGFRCDPLSGLVPYTAYLIPLQTSTTSTNGSEPSTLGVLSTLKATFSPYTQRPAAPTSLNGESGETKLTVTFKAPSSSMTLTKYKAYFDVGGGQGGGAAAANADAGIDAGTAAVTGGMDAGLDGGVDASTENAGSTGATAACGSGLLENNQLPPVNQPTTLIRETKESTSTTVALTDLQGVAIDQVVAAAAVAIDPAGNESKLSNPICITRVETNGFADACRNTPGCIEELDGCSLNPGRSTSAWLLSMVALALSALIRRRGRA